MTDPESCRRARELIASVSVWYHAIEVLPGVVTPGVYDMRPHLARFHVPASLAGKNVVDVGAANGFFAFEFERLGAASVLAVEPHRMSDLDFPRWYVDQQRARYTECEIAAIDDAELHAGFRVAKQLLGSKVERLCARIYDLPQITGARFDLAFCCNVLEHLRDPVAGIEALRAVLLPHGRLILAAPVDLTSADSYAMFRGDPARSLWWVPSRAALLGMCAMAGFRAPAWMDAFPLASTLDRGPPPTLGVVHCVKE
ncbi:MAG: methyltransferase domain-containing protein [Planctomycetota bacterium]